MRTSASLLFHPHITWLAKCLRIHLEAGTHQVELCLALIDEGVRRMHELLGDSDISTVDADERLWFLVGDGASLIRRVRAMYPPDSDAQLRTAFVNLRDVGDARDPRQVMSRLKTELL